MIYFQEDSDSRFFPVEAGTMTIKDLDAIIEALSQTRVDVYIVEINSRQANYPSQCHDSFLDGFDIGQGMMQEVLRGDTKAWAYRRRANIQVLHNQNIDSNQYLLDGARRIGKIPWLGIRMNDIHSGHDLNDSIHGAFWRNHPELWISPLSCENGFDYTHETVRNYFLDFIEEAVLRYNVEGVFLDWMRWPTFFPVGTGKERAHLLSDFLRQLHCRLKKNGYSVPLHCRVPLRIKFALERGLDAVTWAKEKLIDKLFIGQFGSAAEFDAPVEEWHQAIGGKFPVIVSLEATFWPSPANKSKREMTVEDARGIAAAAYHRSAVGIHFFNFQGWHRREPIKAMAEILLNELDSPEKFIYKTRIQRVNWDDSALRVYELDQISLAPGFHENWLRKHRGDNSYPAELPCLLASGDSTVFRLYTAEPPDLSAVAQLIIIVDGDSRDMAVEINSISVSIPSQASGQMTIAFLASMLQSCWTAIRITAGDTPLTINELWLKMPGKKKEPSS